MFKLKYFKNQFLILKPLVLKFEKKKLHKAYTTKN